MRTQRAPIKNQALAILRDRGVPVGTVLDVGVLTCTGELIETFPDKKHVLFEPVEEFADEIAKNYQKIDHELHVVAVGAESGSVTLKTFQKVEGQSISHSSMAPGAVISSPDTRTVQKVALDDFIPSRHYCEPFLLKIDIDGFELEVVKGARNILPLCSVVMIECAGNSLPGRIGAIQEFGFKLFDLAEPCYYDDSFWQCDAIFVRNDIHSNAFKTLSGKVEPGLYKRFGDVA